MMYLYNYLSMHGLNKSYHNNLVLCTTLILSDVAYVDHNNLVLNS